MVDTLVIGGGQAGLSLGYYLRRESVDFRIVDAEPGPGGAWRHTWESLHLFSPAASSSLPGWRMLPSAGATPHRDEVVDYLRRYEARYDLQVVRPLEVEAIRPQMGGFEIRTSRGVEAARAVVMATGTWRDPKRPFLAGEEDFEGRLLHSAHYSSAREFEGLRVAVIGAGNSGAQIVADLAGSAAKVHWICREPPVFLPPEVDGADLFRRASERFRALKEGRPAPPRLSLGDIVQIPAVKKARSAGHLEAEPMVDGMSARGLFRSDGSTVDVDAVIFATGFGAALDPLEPLGLEGLDGRIQVDGTRAADVPGLWLVGYGGWTGYASATLIGVGRTARSTAREVSRFLASG